MAKTNTNPEVRFAGFTEDWEVRELSKILTERKAMQKITEDAPILAFAAGQGVIDRSERKSNNRDHLTHDQENKVYKLTELNDIVYNPSNLKYGAIDRNKHGRGVISPIYVTFISNEEPSFIELHVKSEKFKLRALQYEEGTVVKRQSVKPENLLSLKVIISPSKDEQKLIGNFFENIDNLIIEHQQKHIKLKILKQAMLDKMFPKQGQFVPEIRFKGFEGHWEDVAFGKIFQNISNNSLSRENLNYNSGIAKNVHYGDILVKFNEVLDVQREVLPFITEDEIVEKLKSNFLKDGDIIISDAAEDQSVGKCVEIVNINNCNILSGLHTIAVRPKQKFAQRYLGYYMNSNCYHNQLIRLMQGTKVLSISKTALKNTKIQFPADCEEQKMIGNYFKNLDKLIANHETQITKLRNIKKAFLAKMFV